jgi:hypothetical protein
LPASVIAIDPAAATAMSTTGVQLRHHHETGDDEGHEDRQDRRAADVGEERDHAVEPRRAVADHPVEQRLVRPSQVVVLLDGLVGLVETGDEDGQQDRSDRGGQQAETTAPGSGAALPASTWDAGAGWSAGVVRLSSAGVIRSGCHYPHTARAPASPVRTVQ